MRNARTNFLRKKIIFSILAISSRELPWTTFHRSANTVIGSIIDWWTVEWRLIDGYWRFARVSVSFGRLVTCAWFQTRNTSINVLFFFFFFLGTVTRWIVASGIIGQRVRFIECVGLLREKPRGRVALGYMEVRGRRSPRVFHGNICVTLTDVTFYYTVDSRDEILYQNFSIEKAYYLLVV